MAQKQKWKSINEKTRNRVTVQMKKAMISKVERGRKIADVAREYGLARTTVSSIIHNKEKIKTADVAKGVTILNKTTRSPLLDEVEKLLLIWIKDKQMAGDSISEAIICEKAKQLHSNLQKNQPGTSTENNDFKASRGWFYNFKNRSGIHSVLRHEEATGSCQGKTKNFVKEFQKFVVKEGYLLQQVFNYDEIRLFWKKMSKRTYITQEENELLESKPMKDQITLLPGTSRQSDNFKASRGWFYNFKIRNGIRSIVRHGDATSSDQESANSFVKEFQEFVVKDGYLPQQVFTLNETGLFWKKMPKYTDITHQESKLSGHKFMKDQLVLLLCGNAFGDCKIEPLLVYHSENPEAFKKKNVDKNRLGVMWRSHPKALVTRKLFTEWMYEMFVPSVKDYLENNHLPMKALLIINSSPAHPVNLMDELVGSDSFIKIIFLPCNTSPLLHPMNQKVISDFKKLYVKTLFEKCFQVTNDTNLTLKDFWTNHFNILHCIRIIVFAWKAVSPITLNSAWQKLWPKVILNKDSSQESQESIVKDIVFLGKSMGLKIDCADVEELVEDYRREFTVDELQEEHKELTVGLPSTSEKDDEEEIEGAKIPTEDLERIFKLWTRLQNLVEKWHPDFDDVSLNIENFDRDIDYFRKVIQVRQQQLSLDSCLTKKRKHEVISQPEIPNVLLKDNTPLPKEKVSHELSI